MTYNTPSVFEILLDNYENYLCLHGLCSPVCYHCPYLRGVWLQKAVVPLTTLCTTVILSLPSIEYPVCFDLSLAGIIFWESLTGNPLELVFTDVMPSLPITILYMACRIRMVWKPPPW